MACLAVSSTSCFRSRAVFEPKSCLVCSQSLANAALTRSQPLSMSFVYHVGRFFMTEGRASGGPDSARQRRHVLARLGGPARGGIGGEILLPGNASLRGHVHPLQDQRAVEQRLG